MNTTLPTLQFIAMNNVRDCIIISDARLPDNPLIFVNACPEKSGVNILFLCFITINRFSEKGRCSHRFFLKNL